MVPSRASDSSSVPTAEAMFDDRFAEYARTRDAALRNELVEAHLPLARRLARRFAHRGEPVEDLEQVAALALVKAVERFDPDRAGAFTTFAVPTILGEIKRHFRDRAWAVRVSRRVQERYLELGTTVATMSQELGRPPTLAELAENQGAAHAALIEAMEAGRTAYRGVSLDAVPTDDDGPSHGELLGEDDLELAAAEWRAALRPLLTALPERERLILYLRYFEERTQAEIARRVGISQMHVSRLIRASLDELRDKAGEPLEPEAAAPEDE